MVSEMTREHLEAVRHAASVASRGTIGLTVAMQRDRNERAARLAEVAAMIEAKLEEKP